MIFLLSLALIFVSEYIFVSGFLNTSNIASQIFGYFQLAIFLSSVLMLFLYFRKRQKQTDFKKGFYSFGVMVSSGVPAMAFLIPGILFLITGNEIFQWIGWSFSACLFSAILIGIFWGRWNWKVHQIVLEFHHLPDDFHEVKILQISDIHVGSFFNNYEKVKKAIQKMNGLNPDFVFFTGDLVNNTADELIGWEEVFKEIQAKKGKFSILGNHDYGDYVKWESHEKKSENLAKLIDSHRKIGFTPLLNESIQLTYGFWLLGVENWGKAPFRQSGKLDETLRNIPNEHFKLLLSHDPSHFDEQVLDTNIDLTLSGHTHGMQFGIERFGLKWSPVSLRYKKWAGLYQEGNQFLYVNRGFGYLGFPGRVGIYPEITEIVLKKK
jgi:predicted MPP superfamily phosphohydrolase